MGSRQSSEADQELDSTTYKTDQLMSALKEDRLDDVNQLLTLGASVGGDPFGRTMNYPVLFQYYHSSMASCILEGKVNYPSVLFYAIRHDHVEVIRDLVQQGADINAHNDRGNATIHASINYGKPEMVKLLLELGADVNLPDKYGRTPLHLAGKHGYVEITRLLLEAGANVSFKDEDGETPIDFVLAQNHIKVLHMMENKLSS